jgi:DNA sulfur modification protein DndC
VGDSSTSTTRLSVFATRTLDEVYDQVRELYTQNSCPWVIGYSGGKDSTAVLQLVWYALSGLSPEKRTKPVFVLSSDTLVETPVIVNLIDQTLERVNKASDEQRMPFQAHKVQPKLEDTFWVNLIGKGYPAPSTRFRWCTDRLKIWPANSFILNCVTKYGEVIVVLGVRKAESATRAQAMSLSKIQGTILRRHSSLPNAFVYAPIEEFSTEDVWSYLLSVPSPWGNQNRDLLALYRNAQAGECPLVVDTTTPSCGNSRFGCWVCTVVARDDTMEALIDNGEVWMEPLLELRDFLASTQEPDNKLKYRDHKRRGGKVSFKSDGSIARGPYYLHVCKEILRSLLEAQKQISQDQSGNGLELISEPELHEIRRIWKNERQDWEDSVPKIFQQVMGRNLYWPADDGPNFSSADWEILEKICVRESVSPNLVAKLLDTERLYLGMSRRAGIFGRIDNILRENWSSEEEILSQRSQL